MVIRYDAVPSANVQVFIHSFVFTTAAKGGTLSLPVTKEHKGGAAEEFEL